MKRVLKTRNFCRWMKKTELTNEALCSAVIEMQHGLCDATLGGNVYKKRVAFPGKGKSGSTRTLVATNKGNRWFFMYGFKKSEKSNISRNELEALQKIASDFLSLTLKQIDIHIQNGYLQEICNDD